ncbi:MAG: cobyrinate a,c-diamide synthase [Gammaproteobacteria bacterium]
MKRILISAAHKSSGKTTITIGLCAALRARGLAVQPFKKGPDYIDPMWLSAASGRDCDNLDFYLMGHDEITATFARRMHGADIGIIEGNKGLYDGLDLDGSNSNAALARLLDSPVVLVIDARGMTRGIAPLILGYQAFEPGVRIAGVILNQLGGSRHESKLRAVIEHYTDVPVMGAVHHDDRLGIVERHLGLMPSNEVNEAQTRIAAIAEVVARSIDLDRLLQIAAAAPALVQPPVRSTIASPPSRPDRIRLAIARDAAFGFYYPGDLEALRAAGAELVPFDTLRDARLPTADALFIGGGFPETQMERLAANRALRRDIHDAIERGMPAYAECGGLMYLSRSLRWGERRCEMVGVIPADTVMHDRPMGRGYVRLRETGRGPWPSSTGVEVRAHEFHYSSLENIDPNLEYAYEVLRGSGVDGRHDGIVYNNLLACYAHMRHLASNPWAERFVRFINQCRLHNSRATRRL